MDPGDVRDLRPGSLSRWLPVAIAVTQAVVVLGPALGRGVTLRYDMAWSPDPRWTPFVLGLDTPAPRAVPSDAVAVLLGQVMGAGAAQKVILLGILIALGVGAAALVGEFAPRSGAASRSITTVAAVWNPFVHERLMVGQWTVVAGLALLPWVLRQVLRVAQGESSTVVLLVLVVLAGLGGANTLAVVLATALPGLLWIAIRLRSRQCVLGLGAAAAASLGMAAAWALPALQAGARSASNGSTAFAPTADTPLGVLGSLVSGGGLWNTAAHPSARSVAVIAIAAAVMAIVGIVACFVTVPPRSRPLLGLMLGVPTLVTLLSVTDAAQPVWDYLVTELPGGGLLRDSHKFIGAWVVLAAVGLGLAGHAFRARVTGGLRGPVTALLLLLPVALAPYQVWGGQGALAATRVPDAYRSAIATVNAAAAGDVGLLPWNQYRRYEWNDGRVSLTLAPRMLTGAVLYDDRLPLRQAVVPGESPRAAGVSAAIDQGVSPVEALSDAGVRYIVLERTAAAAELEEDVAQAGRLVVETGEVLAVEVAPHAGPSLGGTRWNTIGWAITLGTLALTLLGATTHGIRGRVVRRNTQ